MFNDIYSISPARVHTSNQEAQGMHNLTGKIEYIVKCYIYIVLFNKWLMFFF